MNYDEKLDAILHKYDMYDDFASEYEKVYQKFNQDYAHINQYIAQQVQLFTKKFHKPPKVIIWGGGFFCEHVLLPFEAVKKLDIVAIVDKKVDEGEKFFLQGVEVESIQRLYQDDYDMIIISSSAGRKDMLTVILNDLHKAYIDIFAFDKNIQYATITDLEIKPGISWEYINLSLEDIILSYQQLQTPESLKRLIKAFLYIRDFQLAFAYIDVYLKQDYADGEKLLQMQEEMEALFSDIKLALKSKQEKNVLLFLADGLAYETCVNYMPFIRDTRHFFYDNVRSAAIYTGESLRTIFTGKYLFCDDVHKISDIRAENTTFKEFIDKGYDFVTYDWRYLFNNDSYTRRRVDKKFKVGFQSSYAASVLWDYLCHLVTTNKNTITFMRLEDTHNPFNKILQYAEHDFPLDNLYQSTYHYQELSNNINKYVQLQSSAAKLLDAELYFYLDFLKADDSIVFFADHGVSSLSTESSEINRLHMPIVLIDKNIKGGITSKLMSLRHLGKIVKTLVFQQKVYIQEEEYVFSERMPIYGESLRKKYIDLKIPQNCTSLRHISTSKDRYVVWGDKREEYYLGRSHDDNFSNLNKERLSYFRTINQAYPLPEDFTAKGR